MIIKITDDIKYDTENEYFAMSLDDYYTVPKDSRDYDRLCKVFLVGGQLNYLTEEGRNFMLDIRDKYHLLEFYNYFDGTLCFSKYEFLENINAIMKFIECNFEYNISYCNDEDCGYYILSEMEN